MCLELGVRSAAPGRSPATPSQLNLQVKPPDGGFTFLWPMCSPPRPLLRTGEMCELMSAVPDAHLQCHGQDQAPPLLGVYEAPSRIGLGRVLRDHHTNRRSAGPFISERRVRSRLPASGCFNAAQRMPEADEHRSLGSMRRTGRMRSEHHETFRSLVTGVITDPERVHSWRQRAQIDHGPANSDVATERPLQDDPACGVNDPADHMR